MPDPVLFFKGISFNLNKEGTKCWDPFAEQKGFFVFGGFDLVNGICHHLKGILVKNFGINSFSYLRAMTFFFDAILGFIISLIGVSLPGLINMTALKVCMERGLRAGLKFCLGACITIFLQAWLAVAFAGYLNKHTSILSFLKGASVFIFVLLAIVFYFQAIRKKAKQARSDQGKPIMLGMGIAAMNLLNIPFYLAAGTVLEGAQYIDIYFPVYFFFIGGLTLGSGAALLCYVYGAKWILERAKFFTRHLNYFLSGLFLLLAIVQMVQIYYT